MNSKLGFAGWKAFHITVKFCSLEICLIRIWPAPHNGFLELAEYSKSAQGRAVLTKSFPYFSVPLETCLIGIWPAPTMIFSNWQNVANLHQVCADWMTFHIFAGILEMCLSGICWALTRRTLRVAFPSKAPVLHQFAFLFQSFFPWSMHLTILMRNGWHHCESAWYLLMFKFNFFYLWCFEKLIYHH